MKKYKDGYLLHFTDTFDLEKKVKIILHFNELQADARCAKLDSLEVKYTRLRHGILIVDGRSIKPEHESNVTAILSGNDKQKSLFEMCEITEIK